jgi:hypothetical protein
MSAALSPYAAAQRRDAQRRRWIAAIATPTIGAVIVAMSIFFATPPYAVYVDFIALAVAPLFFVLGMTTAGAAARARVAAIVIVGACGSIALGVVQNYLLIDAARGTGADFGLPFILPAVGALAAFVGSLVGLVVAKVVLGQVRSAAGIEGERPRSCPCGYPREGLTSDVCPECGRKSNVAR